GYWLPNDPRGSTPTEVRVELIHDLGDIYYSRKLVQPSSKEIREFHKNAHDILKHPVLTFDDDEIVFLGKVFGDAITEKDYICYACALMPDHVHLLIRRHRDNAEAMIALFQDKSRAALIDAGKRSPTHPVWTKGPGWKSFINTRKQFEKEIDYIRRNPVKIGRPEQSWDFVQPYDGWLP